MRSSRLPLLAVALVGLLAAHVFGQAGPESIKLRFLGFNIAAPGTATNIITTDAVGNTIPGIVARDVGKLRIQIQVATTTVVDLSATDGTTTKLMHLNGGTAVPAGCLYEFEWLTTNARPFQDQNPKPITWNVQVETNSAIDELHIDEVNNGT